MKFLVLALSLAICACGPATYAAAPEYSYQVVHTYPHDSLAFTEGLFYLDGFLWESTGLEGESSIRKVRLETGEIVQKRDLPAQYFGEGIINWKDKLIQLTWALVGLTVCLLLVTLYLGYDVYSKQQAMRSTTQHSDASAR